MFVRFPFKSLILALCALCSVEARAETRLRLQEDRPGATIHKNVYGQFAEHLGRGIYEGLWVGAGSRIPNTRGFRNDVLRALKELQVPVVRWPGGCYADQYHWQDGIGPQAQRKKTVNATWGDVVEDNSFGTHEFFELVEQLGADAYVNVNVGSGTPREMMEWIEYMTSASDSTLANLRRKNGRAKPWRVHYLGIGNEPWGCGGSMSPQHYSDVYRHYATFVKTPADNRPILIASGGSGDETIWTRQLVDSVKESWTLRMEGIAHHYYTIPTGSWEKKGFALGFPESEWFSALFQTLRIRGFLENNVRILDGKDPQKKIGFFVDEWGTWYDSSPGASQANLYQQNSLRDALIAALNFHAFHDFAERVRMTNIAQMVNVLQAMILTQGERMVLTPTYHAFHLYRPFQGARQVRAELRDVPDYRVGARRIAKVSATAAIAKDGKLYVGLVNTHPSEPERVRVAGTKPLSKASGRLLTASALDAHNTFSAPEAVRPTPVEFAAKGGQLQLELPPKSIVVLALE